MKKKLRLTKKKKKLRENFHTESWKNDTSVLPLSSIIHGINFKQFQKKWRADKMWAIGQKNHSLKNCSFIRLISTYSFIEIRRQLNDCNIFQNLWECEDQRGHDCAARSNDKNLGMAITAYWLRYWQIKRALSNSMLGNGLIQKFTLIKVLI